MSTSARPHFLVHEAASFSSQKAQAEAEFRCECGALFPVVIDLQHEKPEGYETWNYELARSLAEKTALETARDLYDGHIETFERGGYGESQEAEVKQPRDYTTLRKQDEARFKTPEEKFEDARAIVRANTMAKEFNSKFPMWDGHTYKPPQYDGHTYADPKATTFDIDGFSQEALNKAVFEQADEFEDVQMHEPDDIYEGLDPSGNTEGRHPATIIECAAPKCLSRERVTNSGFGAVCPVTKPDQGATLPAEEVSCDECGAPIYQTELGGWHHGPKGSVLVRVFCYTGDRKNRVATPRRDADVG